MLTLMVLIYPACSEREPGGSSNTPVLNAPPNTAFPMPPSTTKTLAEMGWTLPDGKRASLQDYHGKVLILDFYATWCQPCRRSIPYLNSLHRILGRKGLEVVGLNVGGPDDRVKVADFSRELAIEYPLGFPDKSLTDFLLSNDDSIPQTFIFDRKGHLMKRIIGYDDSARQVIDQVVNSGLLDKGAQ